MSPLIAIFISNFILSILYIIVLSFQIQSYLKKNGDPHEVPSFAHSSNGAAMLYALNFRKGTCKDAHFERDVIVFRRRYYVAFAFALISLITAMLVS